MSDIEVAVLSRKVMDLEADLAALRRGMVAQLSATGRMSKALFDLDDIRFGGRHQRAATEGRSPGQDLVLAERILSSLTDNLSAAELRAETAELARREAEQAVSRMVESRAGDSASTEIAAVLAEREAELSRLQAQALLDREANARQAQDLIRSIAQVREALAREQDLRRADQAEARSLAAEIERMAVSDPEARRADDLEITISILHDAISGPEVSLDTITGAAEAVLLGWSRVLWPRTWPLLAGSLRSRPAG